MFFIVPSDPKALSLVVLSATSVEAAWEMPFRLNGRLLGFTLFYLRHGQEENLTVVTGLQSVIVFNLHPYTVYTFEVAGQTSAGIGDRSVPATVRTSESGRQLRFFFITALI